MFFLAVFIFAGHALQAQYRTVNNTAFQRGEKLVYNAYYDSKVTGKVKAGTATLEIKNENQLINNRNTLHVVAQGKTIGAFNLFFKVVDRYETYMDEEAIAPWLFIRRVYEGGYTINQDITFNQAKKLAILKDNKQNRTSTISTPAYIQDIISAFYYARTYDFENAEINSNFPVKFMLDDTIYSTTFTYLGKALVNTSFGKVRCLKFKPQVLTGTTFKDPYPMLLYVTDDKNHMPVLAESEILVGKVKLSLISFSGLRNKFTALADE